MSRTINSIQRDTKKMTPEDAARTYFLNMPETGDMEGCINSCIQRLIVEKRINEESARQIALSAWADLRCINNRSFIDVDHCTSKLVVVKTPDGIVYITLNDLLTFATGRDSQELATVH